MDKNMELAYFDEMMIFDCAMRHRPRPNELIRIDMQLGRYSWQKKNATNIYILLVCH